MYNIPGGRPRASSDGDILDDGLCSPFFVNQGDLGVELELDYHGNKFRSRSRSPLSLNKHYNHSTGFSSHSCLDNDAFSDSDNESTPQSHASTSTEKSHKLSIFSFKSVKKAVSRRFAKDTNSRFFPPARKTDPRFLKKGDLTKIWTPDLRNLGHSFVLNSDGSARSIGNNTMSTARPLITDPNVSMTVPKWKRTPGVIGIFNHGNSCFINAVLQCLSNTDSFTEYFVKDFFKLDLKNSKNSKKSVTEQLGILLKSIWSGKYNSDVSREFKSVVGKFSSQYKGDHQHDAQEFLLWLLDRIHEDVCIYLKKKLKAQKSPLPAKSDEDAASEAASVNGESFVVRLFQALHASTLTCPTCQRCSSTFDPYLCVSLPLPQHCPRQLSVVLVPYVEERLSPISGHRELGEASVRVILTVNQYDTVGELKAKLCSELAELDLKAKKLILVQLKNDGFGSTYSNEQPVSDIGEGESLYAVEAAFSPETLGAAADEERNTDIHASVRGAEEFDTPMAQVMVVHVEVSPGSNRSYRFANPAMLKVRRDITWKSLQKEILYKMGDVIHEEVLMQKLSPVFKLRVYDGSPRRNSLSSDIEMPLYTQDVERAFETLDEDFGPLHIKLTAEWDLKTKNVMMADSSEYFEEHKSVHDAQRRIPGQSRVSLDECFKLYTQEEKLIGEDAWICPHCKQQQQGTIKTLGLWSLPDILVLHLKRFKQTGLRRSKLNTLVDFPVEGLDMSPYLARRKETEGGSSVHGRNNTQLRRDDYTYDLLGVSNHYGNMMGGHYIAVCKSPVDGIWREFNDQRVRSLEEGEPIATKEAYLLFYQRRSLGKDINHRLFTGDHWVFSLSLASSELREDGSSSGGSTPRGEIIPIMPPPSQTVPFRSRQRSLPRSVSPSVLKYGTKEHTTSWAVSNSRRSASSSRPLTPQPHRKPINLYAESRYSDGENGCDNNQNLSSPTRDSSSRIKNTVSRKSRPVQRQASEPGPRRGKTLASASTDTSQAKGSLYDQQSQCGHQRQQELISNGRSGRESDLTVTTKFVNTVKDEIPSKSPFRHESLGFSDAVPSLSSRSIDHPPIFQSNRLELNVKYPSSYENENFSDHKDIYPISAYEPASALRVRLDGREPSDLVGHSLPSSSQTNTLSAASARRRLAERIEEPKSPKSYNKYNSGRFEKQKSYELAQQKLLRLDSDLRNLTLLSGEQLGHHHSLDFDKSQAEDQGRWERTIPDYLNNNNKFLHPNEYSRLDSDVEEEEEGEETEEPWPRSNLQTQLQDQYDHIKDLAEKHFGPRPYKKEKYVSLLPKDDLLPTSYEISPVSKYAPMGRRVTDHGSSSAIQVPDCSMPRSSTDHSIQYSLTRSELPAPPSPTPPRGTAEERTFSYSSHHGMRLNERAIQAMHAYEFAGKRVLDQDLRSSSGVRTFPGYYSNSSVRESRHNFRPPRSTWGKVVRAREGHQPAIPTPCLRESSV
ncbi:hypothetical protein EGW08_019830 [Elysia chlorotica]|uniref:ubiquitinyl hydrolase 1 n=1 Tax=Elysia chlorotica TaxID=188477 RepID=A0A433ST28_ELYCH|nr:hypothetical protein EGW08_019830 [Elysia chlorotica]